MLTVSEGADESLRSGSLRCPNCQGALRPWGFARLRLIRIDRGHRWVRPRRARCGDCGRTQVLLPWDLLERRRDAVADIGAVLEAYATRTGYRRAARDRAIPVPTARNWVRRLRGRWPALVATLERDPPAARGPGADDPAGAIAAIRDRADRAGWGVAPWSFMSMRTNGALLRPGPPNTT